MKKVTRILMAGLIAVVLSLGALAPMSALGQKNDNRPPKDPEKVRQPNPPPRNTNSQGNRNRNKP
jgi:hypothetical protein